MGLGGELDLFKMEYQSRVSALQKAELQSPMAALGRLATVTTCIKPDKIPEADVLEANYRPEPDKPRSAKGTLGAWRSGRPAWGGAAPWWNVSTSTRSDPQIKNYWRATKFMLIE